MQMTDTIKAAATPEEILHPGSRALFRYWEALRGEMSAPPRDWLDLRKIRSLVPFLFMIERKPGRDYVWRLAGTKVCRLWSMELTGKRWRTIWSSEDLKYGGSGTPEMDGHKQGWWLTAQSAVLLGPAEIHATTPSR